MGLPEALPVMDRRALLRTAILLVGGSVAGLPSLALAQETPAARFFTAAQLATLAEVAEIIIPRTDTPGAKDAKVAESIDALMTNWASARRREDFRKLIDDIDRTALAAGGATLPALAAEKKLEVVRAYDAEKIRGGDQVYSRFKELVLTAYYLSEPGATKELRYELIPGKFEPGVEISPDTRAWAV
jgi:hypothetical protein